MNCTECKMDSAGNHETNCPFYMPRWEKTKTYWQVGWVCPRCGRGNAPACVTCHSKLHGIKNDLMVDEWVGETVSIRLAGLRVVVRMLFTPITECFRHPLPLLGEAKRYGDKWAQDITDQFGGDIFVVGKTYEKDLYLDNNVFYKSFKDSSAEEFILSLIENKDSPVEDFSEIGEAFFLALSVGPVLCACKNHE